MIHAHLMLAFFTSLTIFAANTNDKGEESVPFRVRFERMTEEEKRESLRLNFEQVADLQHEIEAKKNSSPPNRSSPKELKESSLSDPQITDRPKLSPSQRILRKALSPRKASSEQKLSILNKSDPHCVAIPQEPSSESSGKWWKKFIPSSRKREEGSTHKILSTTQDNPRYGAYINHFSTQLEKNLIKLFFELPYKEHLRTIKELSIKQRENKLRQSETFEEEYKILRLLWKPIINRFFSEFQLSEESENIFTWKNLVKEHFGVHVHAIDLSLLKNPVPPDDFSTLEMPKKIALWAEMTEHSNQKPLEAHKKTELTNEEISYLKFLQDIAEIICNAPPKYKHFFYALSKALKKPFGTHVLDTGRMERLVVTNFFLFVIQPLILDMRASPVVLDKETINQLENAVSEKNSWQVKNMRLNQEKVLLKAMTLKMTERSLEIPMTTKLSPNEFEVTLIQILNKTFEPVVQPLEQDSFVDQVERIKQQITEALVTPSKAQQDDDLFAENSKRE